MIPLLLACAAAPPPRRLPPVEGDRPHVVVISIDTLRADHLGAWGNPYGLTPTLDALARRGAAFLDATAPAPTTLAAHTSMMSGLWPHHHGVPRNGFIVPDEVDTLAERLRRVGYHTSAFVGGYPLIGRFGFLQGFDWADDQMDDRGWDPFAAELEQTQRRGDAVTDAVFTLLDEGAPDGRPLMLFVHYFDPHAPYDPPAPWDELCPPESDGSLEERRQVRAAWPDPAVTPLSAALACRYAAEIAFTDHEVGRLLDGLEARLGPSALVVVVSDHGEAFTEHDEIWDHGTGVWQETVHVPWIVVGPGIGPLRIAGPVSTVDVTPTVLGLLGIPVDGPPLDGQDRSAAARGGALAPTRLFTEATKPYPLELEGQWANAGKCHAVREGAYKLVTCPNGAPARALYDLGHDPGERADRLASDPARADALALALQAWSAGDPSAARPDGDPATAALLGALGYVE